MADDNAQDIAAQELPDNPVQAASPPVKAQEPQAPPVKGPDPDKRPPRQEREFRPQVADNFLEIPGALDYIADKIGVKDMQIENARLKAERMGFTQEEAAGIPGATADEILKNAEWAAKYKPAPVEEEAAPPAPQQGHRPAAKPPSNEIPAADLAKLSYEEILKKMAT